MKIFRGVIVIKTRELRYAPKDPGTVLFPGYDYAWRAIDELCNALFKFIKYYEGKQYTLTLSNGEEPVFEIRKNDIAHLLGIDYNTIMNNESLRRLLYSIIGITEGKNIDPFTLLDGLIMNADELIYHDENNPNSSDRLLNYYLVRIKAYCFNQMMLLNEFGYGIINTDRGNSPGVFSNPSPVKTLFFPTNDEHIQFCFLKFIMSSKDNIMIPRSLITSTDFAKYFMGQELLLPKQVTVDGKEGGDPYLPTSEERKQLLLLYNSIIGKYHTESTIRENIRR